MKPRWLLFLSLFSSLWCGELYLKERFSLAKPGDYVVSETDQTISLFAVRSLKGDILLLEEISVPLHKLKKRPTSWADWVKAKAPGHSSWSMMELDLKTGNLLECYSFSKSSWIALSQQESILSTLLTLPMKSIEKDRQKKIGPPPLPGEPDFRKTWHPPFVFEGKKISGVQFDSFETLWPKDDSPLSGKAVLLYFDRKKQLPFPFWIQVNSSHASSSMKTIDSGNHLPSLYRTIPRRIPEFVGMPLRKEDSLCMHIKSPNYYKQFELFAIDVTEKRKQILPISHCLIEGEGEWKTIKIDTKELEKNLEENHYYTWLLVPLGHSESYTETRKPFVWSSKTKKKTH